MKQSPTRKWRWLRTLATLLVCLAILAAAAAAVIYINQTEPTAQKANTARKSAALVETVTVKRGTYSPTISVLGTVQAAQDIVLSPRVSGPIIELSPKLTPGGMVREGDLLLRIDPADFQNAVSIRQSELSQAEASREIEQARQRLAEKELKMLEGSIGTTNRSLVMREPQIASIEAEVSAAEAAVERANLDLNRTSVRAPFDSQVISRSVDVGSQVGPNNELARLVGIKEYWIMAAVPVRSLRWVQFPDRKADLKVASNSEEHDSVVVTQEDPSEILGSNVILRHRDVWGPEVERQARVARMIGTLDRQTRLARVLIIVDDPLGRDSGEPALILDSLMETEIECRPIVDVVRLRRDFVRKGDTVWVMKEEKLQIRDVDVVFQDAKYAYIRSGLDSGEEVVTTTLATVAEGVGLRKMNPAPRQKSQQTIDASQESPSEESRLKSPDKIELPKSEFPEEILDEPETTTDKGSQEPQQDDSRETDAKGPAGDSGPGPVEYSAKTTDKKPAHPRTGTDSQETVE